MAGFNPMDGLPGGSDRLGYLSSRKAGFGAELSECMFHAARVTQGVTVSKRSLSLSV